LPCGTWTHFLSGEQVQGGRWRKEVYDYFSLPLYVRENSLIPIGNQDARPDYDYADGVTLHLFALQEGARVSASVPDVKGETRFSLLASRSGNEIYLSPTGSAPGWSVLLRGVANVASVSGGRADKTEQGLRILPDAAVASIRIVLNHEEEPSREGVRRSSGDGKILPGRANRGFYRRA